MLLELYLKVRSDISKYKFRLDTFVGTFEPSPLLLDFYVHIHCALISKIKEE